MYSILYIRANNEDIIIDSIVSKELFSEWLIHNDNLPGNPTELVEKECKVSDLEVADLESGLYLIVDGNNYSLVQLEKNVITGYIYGSTICNKITVLDQWKLIKSIQNCVKDLQVHNNLYMTKTTIPRCAQTLRICWQRQDKLRIGEIPYSTTTLYLLSYHPELEVGIIPKSVNHLIIGTHYNKTLKKGYIPDSVKVLELQCDPEILEEGAIPDSVTHLIYSHNKSIYIDEAMIPDSVKDIDIRCETIQ